MHKGTVKWFNKPEGLRIYCDEEETMFVHYSGLNMEVFQIPLTRARSGRVRGCQRSKGTTGIRNVTKLM